MAQGIWSSQCVYYRRLEQVGSLVLIVGILGSRFRVKGLTLKMYIVGPEYGERVGM